MTDVAGKRSAKRGFPWRNAVQSRLSFALVAAIFGFAVPSLVAPNLNPARKGDVAPKVQ